RLLSTNTHAATDLYTLSLHDALPISATAVDAGTAEGAGGDRRPAIADRARLRGVDARPATPRPAGRAIRPIVRAPVPTGRHRYRDRKSTRLNSSHVAISYAVFCLKKI